MRYFNAKIWQDGSWQRVRLGPAKAIELLADGHAELEAQQVVPPTELLGLLEDYLSGPEKFGKPTNAPALLRKVSENAFRGNLRQHSIDGKALHWISGSSRLRFEVEMLLSEREPMSSSLFEQFRGVLSTRIGSVTDSIKPYREISLEEQRARGIVPEPLSLFWFVGDGNTFKQVGREWQQFHERFHAIENRLTGVINRGISEGRILCAQDDPKGDQLLPPDIVKPLEEHHPDGNIWYLLTSDLPAGWFSPVDTLPFQRKQAIAWVNRAGHQLYSRGLRATVEQLQRISCEKFDLTPHAVQTLWSKTAFPNKGKKGSISNDHRVSDNDVREIE